MRKLNISCSASKKEIGSMKISFSIFWFIINKNRAKVFRFAIHSRVIVVAVHWIRISFKRIFSFWYPYKTFSSVQSQVLDSMIGTIYVQFLFPGHGPSSASPEHLDSAYSQIPVSDPWNFIFLVKRPTSAR